MTAIGNMATLLLTLAAAAMPVSVAPAAPAWPSYPFDCPLASHAAARTITTIVVAAPAPAGEDQSGQLAWMLMDHQGAHAQFGALSSAAMMVRRTRVEATVAAGDDNLDGRR